MTQGAIPATDPYRRRRVAVLDSEMAYVDTGTGESRDRESRVVCGR